MTAAKVTFTIPEGREALVIGPHCWGRGKTFDEALANAKKNRVRAYEGPNGFRYIVYSVAPGTYVNDMGGICYKNDEDPAGWPVELGRVGKF